MTDTQKSLVTNADYLEKAASEITKKLADIEEAKELVTEIMDGFQYELTAEQVFSLMDSTGVFEVGMKEMLSRGFVSDMIIQAMSGERVAYANLNYLSKSSMDQLENKVVENLVHRYDMQEPIYINDRITIDVKVSSLFGGMVKTMLNEMLEDFEQYINNNKTTLTYMKRYYSETEFYRSLMDMWISAYSSTWLREVDSWRYNAESTQLTWSFTLSEVAGEWKIIAVRIEGEE